LSDNRYAWFFTFIFPHPSRSVTKIPEVWFKWKRNNYIHLWSTYQFWNVRLLAVLYILRICIPRQKALYSLHLSIFFSIFHKNECWRWGWMPARPLKAKGLMLLRPWSAFFSILVNLIVSLSQRQLPCYNL